MIHHDWEVEVGDRGASVEELLGMRERNQGVELAVEEEDRAADGLNDVDVPEFFIDYKREEGGPTKKRFSSFFD